MYTVVYGGRTVKVNVDVEYQLITLSFEKSVTSQLDANNAVYMTIDPTHSSV